MDSFRGAKCSFERFTTLWYHFEPLYKLTRNYQLELKHITNGFFKFCQAGLDEKVEEFRKHGKSDSNKLIDILLEDKNQFTDSEIRDNINVFMSAGHETSVCCNHSMLIVLINC